MASSSVTFSVTIQGLEQLKRAFKKSPKLVSKYVNRAIKASVFEVYRQNVDSNLQFKTPRELRTGRLQRSISTNMYFSDMYGRIGPDTVYMYRVHKNNEFMPRLQRRAQGQIDRHFVTALEQITKELAS